LGNGLAIGKGKVIEVLPSEMTKVFDVREHGLPVEGLLLRVSQLLEFAIQVLEFRGQFLTAQL
jgi:hypothetical protein